MIVVVAFAFCSLTAAVSSRLIDPMTTVMARDLMLPVTTVALLTTAYALPFALGQPLLGPIGDSWGRSRLLKTCLWVLAACLTLCALAPTFEVLLSMRFLAGIAAGGIVPSAMAMIGDRFTGNQRQIMVGRLVSVALVGQIVSAALAGLVAEQMGWRLPLAIAAAIALTGALLATRYIDEPGAKPSQAPSFAAGLAGYRTVFANPKAFLCYGTVFLEGVAFFGATPYVAEILERSARGGATEAGLMLGGFGLGGIIFSLSLPWLLPRLTKTVLMAGGGIIAGLGLAGLAAGLPAPPVALLFTAGGFGFFALHNSIQTETLELAPAARSSSYAAHAFSFFSGQALGPVLFGAVLERAGAPVALAISIAVLAGAGVVVAGLFHRLAQRQASHS